MAAPQPTLQHRAPSREDLVRALVAVIAVVAVMAILTAAFGVTQSGPSYELIPDPAGALPF
jgi:hypothetical protein